MYQKGKGQQNRIGNRDPCEDTSFPSLKQKRTYLKVQIFHLQIKWSFTRRSATRSRQASSLMHSRQRVQERGLAAIALRRSI